MTTRVSKRKHDRKAKPIAAAPAWHEREWLILLLLAIATLAVFAPACANEFLFWDDNLNVWKNASFNPPTISSVLAFWKGPFLDLYVPITYTVWGVLSAVAMMPTRDSRGSQLDPYIFHTANVLVHVAAVLLAYAILRRLVGKKWPAAAGAMLFAVHPLQVEPVAWVTGMKDVLCGALSLAALWQYIVYAHMDRDGVQGNRRWRHYATAMLFFALAVLAKPSAVTIPALAFALDLGLIRKTWKKAIVELSPMFVLAAVAVVMSIKFQTVIEPADGGHTFLRPLIATDTLAFYLYKLVFPWWLGVQYNRAPLTVIRAGWLYLTWIGPAAVIAVALIFRRTAPWALVAAAIFILAIAPVSGIVPFSFQQYATVADRYVYVAMLGPALALAAGLAALATRRCRATAIIVSLALLAISIRSFAQTFVWHDNKTLFNNALAVNPRSSLAYNYLAGELAIDVVPDETREAAMLRITRAKYLAERAVELAPTNPDGYLTLGTMFNMMGDLNGATQAFAKAAELAPTKSEALDSYGGALAAQGNPDNLPQAEKLLRRAIQINPRLAKAHLNLGVLLSQLRGSKDPDVFEQIEQAVRLDGGDVDAQTNLAKLYIDRHDRYHALEHVTIALQIDPNNPKALAYYNFLNRLRP
jgi:Tfp pilus assembly protein PilF